MLPTLPRRPVAHATRPGHRRHARPAPRREHCPPAAGRRARAPSRSTQAPPLAAGIVRSASRRPARHFLQRGSGGANRRSGLATWSGFQIGTSADVRASAWLGLAETALAAGNRSEAQRAAEGFLREVPPDDPRAARAHLVVVRTLEAQGADGPRGHRDRPIERTLPPPPPVTPPVTAPVTPAAPARLPEPPGYPRLRRLRRPPLCRLPARRGGRPPGAEPQRPDRPNAPRYGAASKVSVDASDFPFTYYLRQLHAKVSEQWRRPPVVSSEQSPTVIYFEITREGQMRGEPRIKQSSGSELYDQAALLAVVGSISFPPASARVPRPVPADELRVRPEESRIG